jgi:hypothetical protein
MTVGRGFVPVPLGVGVAAALTRLTPRPAERGVAAEQPAAGQALHARVHARVVSPAR